MTPRQQKCFDILMYHFDKALDELMTFDGDLDKWLEQLDKKLDQTATVVDTVAAGATLGVLLMPLTGGTSLAVTAVCETIAATITIGKALNGCVRALMAGSDQPPVSPQCEAALASFKTSTRVGMTMVSHAIIVYYGHIINEVMEECSLPTFASYGASRVLKRLKAELKQQLKTYQDPTFPMKVMLVPEVFIDYLLQSVTLSQRSEKIMLNPKYCPANWMGSREMPVKWAFSRSRLALPLKSSSPVTSSLLALEFYASANEGHFLSDGTLECYGYVMLQRFCDRTSALQINHRRYQAYRIGEANEREARSHLTLYLAVSKQQVKDYVAHNKLLLENKSPPMSLNDFLTRDYGVSVIAVIHDDVLSFLDLSCGDFSSILGASHVVIQNSNLCGSKWDGAFLPYSTIQHVSMDENTSFRDAFLEFSEFNDVVLTGDWSNTRINFSRLKDCKISTRMLDKTTNWSWVSKNNVVMDDEREQILALSSAAAADIVDSKIEESESKIEAQLSQKVREIEEAAAAVRELERVKEEELIKWRDEQKRLEAKQAEVAQDIFNQLYALRNQPEIDLMLKVNERFKALYKFVITQPHVDLWIKVGNKPQTNMSMFVSDLRENDSSFTAAVVEGALGSGKTTDISSALVSLRTDTDIDDIDFLDGERLSTQKQDEWVLEFFSLWKIREFTESDLLTACLNKNGYVTTQEIELLKTKPCLFVLDGLEDCQVNINQHAILDEIYRHHQDWKKLVIIVTVTSEYRKKHPSFYERMGYGSFSALPEDVRVQVLPFTKSQIDGYFRLYFPKQFSLEDPEFAEKFPVKEIYRMARSPIMAHIICEVFSGKEIGRVPQTPIQFCNAFIQLWYLSIQEKAKNNSLSLISIDIQDFIKTIAFEMFRQKQPFIDRPFESERGFFQEHLELRQAATMLAMLFTDPQCKKAGTLMPLSVEIVEGKNRYKFLHKFIHFFALAMKLIDILEHESLPVCIDSWNHDFVIERDIYMFMDGFFKERCSVHGNEALMLDKLRQMVGISASDHSKAMAASNAITFMNTLRYDFSRHINKDEWRGIHVPNANLRRARLARLNFSGTGNFQNVQFQHAELAGTNFQGCETTDARFLSDAEKHHYVSRRPQAVTRYKNDTMDVITYAIPVASEEAEHQIINLGLDGKKYPVIDGHKSKVLCMEWGIDGLISASKNGTIRFWSEKGDRIQTFKYDEKTPIYSLSWHCSGHIFASVGADGDFYLWNTRSSDPLMQRTPVGGVLRRVLFGQSVLLIGGDLGKLHVWDYRYEVQFSILMKREIDFRHSIQSMAWSPRETSVALGLSDGKIYLQKISAIQPSRDILNGHRGGAVKSIAWHKNGEMLITGGEDGGIYTWDVTRKELLSIQYGDGTPIEQLCILADGRRVLAAQDRMLSIWETETAATKNVGYEDEITHRIKCIQAYEDRFVTGHIDGRVIEWHANGSGQRVLTELYRHESPVELMTVSPDHQYLVTSDALHTVCVFDRRTRITQSMTLPITSAKIQDIHWIKDSNLQYYLAAGTNQGILVWELDSAERKWIQRTITYLIDTPCIASQVLGDLCAVSDGASITLLSYGPGNIFQRTGEAFRVSSFPVVQLTWSSDDEWLAVMDESSKIYLFNTRTLSSQCLDEERSQEKEMFWVNRDGRLYLLVSSLEEIKWAEFDERGAARFRKISSGTERLAIGENQYYLASKMSVDIMQLANEHLVYITRVGTGLCTRDANFTDVKVLREDESKALEVHGAIVPKPSWFNFSFFSREQVHPLPIRTHHVSLQKHESRRGLLRKGARKSTLDLLAASVDEDGENSSPSSSIQTFDITSGELSGKRSSPEFS